MPFLPAIPGPYLVPLGPVLTVTLSNIYLEAAHRDHCGGHGTRESGDRPAQARRAQAKATVGRRSLCGFEHVDDDQFNEDFPIGEVLWPMIRDSAVMRAKSRF